MELCEKARNICEEKPELNPTGILFSIGWARRFRERYGISMAKTYGEAASADPAAIQEARDLIRNWLERFGPDNIFNEDETGLFYNLEPNRTLILQDEKMELRGVKKQKDRLTVALCANMTGTIKLPLYCIGKSANPRAFKGFDRERYCKWSSNNTAWMNGDTFRQYLRWFD